MLQTSTYKHIPHTFSTLTSSAYIPCPPALHTTHPLSTHTTHPPTWLILLYSPRALTTIVLKTPEHLENAQPCYCANEKPWRNSFNLWLIDQKIKMNIAPYWSRYEENSTLTAYGNTDWYNFLEILANLGIWTRSFKSVNNLSLSDPIFGNIKEIITKERSNMNKDSPSGVIYL